MIDGELFRVAWLDPESYDYVETTGRLEVRSLDNGEAEPVTYRILKITDSNDPQVEIPLINVSSDGRISKVDDETSADGAIAVWRPQSSLAHVTLNNNKVVTIRAIEPIILNPRNLEFLRLTPVIGDPLIISIDKVDRLVIPVQ